MADRVVTVGDDLTLPAGVIVPAARIPDLPAVNDADIAAKVTSTATRAAVAGVIAAEVAASDSATRTALSAAYVSAAPAPTGTSATDHAALQGLIDAAAASGGGLIILRSGEYRTSGLTLKTGVVLRGQGRYSTVIKLADSTNAPVVQTENFASLTGGDAYLGTPTSFGIEDLTLDGNRANQSATNHALAIYGYGYHLRGIILRYAKGYGLWTEWSTNSPFLLPNGMEAFVTDFKIHDTDAGSIYHKGPHDTQFINGFCVKNSGSATGVAAIEVPTDGRANGSIFTNVHVYGGLFAYGLRNASSGLEFLGCQFEGAQVAQTLILASINKMTECKWFSGGVAGSTVKGIVIGDATHTNINNLRLSGKVETTGGGVLEFATTGGDHTINLHAQFFGSTTVPATPIIGTMDSHSRIEVLIYNAAGTIEHALSQVRFPYNVPVKLGRILGFQQTVATTFTAASGAGTAPPAPVGNRQPSDMKGMITCGTGTTPAAGSQVTVGFGFAYSGTPNVTLTPRNAATAALQPYVANEGTSGFDVCFGIAPAASQAVGTYSLTYHVLQ